MSRSQQGKTFNTAKGENATYDANAQTSYTNAQTDEGNFENQLSKDAADNPYVAGGEFQTATNQELSNTADAGARSASQAIQSAGVRTGQNPAGAIAATEAMNEQNTRDLSSDEATATKDRIGAEAGYNAGVTQLEEQPASFEQQLSQQQGGLAQGALGTQEQAAQAPSFMDELGNGLISAGSAVAGGYGAGLAKGCWIAAELYGGWDDPRTIAVREWLFGNFAKTVHGWLVTRLYLRLGERVAITIRRHRGLRSVMQRLFDIALHKATTDWGK